MFFMLMIFKWLMILFPTTQDDEVEFRPEPFRGPASLSRAKTRCDTLHRSCRFAPGDTLDGYYRYIFERVGHGECRCITVVDEWGVWRELDRERPAEIPGIDVTADIFAFYCAPFAGDLLPPRWLEINWTGVSPVGKVLLKGDSFFLR
jgi:hypothetical protein